MPPGRPISLRADARRGDGVGSQQGETLDDRRECRQSEPEQRRAAEATAASECASLRAEFEALRVELTERWHAELTAIGEALAERTNEVIDQVVMVNKRLRTELCDLVKTQLRDLRARVEGVLPKSALRIARERADDVSESPDPLPPRRVIN